MCIGPCVSRQIRAAPLQGGAKPPGTLGEQLTQIAALGQADGPAEGEAEEDSSYLELLMQNAMSNLRRSDGDEPPLPPPGM